MISTVKKQGHFTYWYDNGIISTEGDYVNGLLTKRRLDGTLVYTMIYSNGKLHGNATYNGNPENLDLYY